MSPFYRGSVFEYGHLQPLVGIYSYQIEDDKLMALGGYEDACHNTIDEIPLLGFGSHSSAPTLDDLRGEGIVESMSWDNEEHGEEAELTYE